MTVKMLFGWLQPAKPVQAPSPKHDLKAAAKDLCEAKVNQPQIVLAKANQPNGMATTTEQSLVKAAKQPLVKAKKAFRNDVFMGSERARPIRVLCEYEETMQRLANENVESTIMFFGSARSKFEDEYKAAVVNARASGNETDLVRLNATAWMCPYMQKVRKLAAACTSWAMERSDITGDPPVLVCTGGGPGFMEAANRGAADVPGGRSIGMGITLPFESGLNPYVTPELAFEYHYFFMRKFWMTFNMRALVVAPGGFGTMDELFELLTLKQTGKIERTFPIVLFGKQYWKDVLNWKAFAEYGVTSPQDIEELLFTDDVHEALAFITDGLTKDFEMDKKEMAVTRLGASFIQRANNSAVYASRKKASLAIGSIVLSA